MASFFLSTFSHYLFTAVPHLWFLRIWQKIKQSLVRFCIQKNSPQKRNCVVFLNYTVPVRAPWLTAGNNFRRYKSRELVSLNYVLWIQIRRIRIILPVSDAILFYRSESWYTVDQKNSDPDPHQCNKWYPEPHQIVLDPTHCFKLYSICLYCNFV